MKSKTDWSGLQRNEADRAHRKEIEEYEATVKAYIAALGEANRARDAALAIKKQKVIVPIVPEFNDGRNEATAFAIGGDWHVEETVDPKTINGLNEFSLDIAAERIARFFRAIIRLTEIERAGTTIDNLVLALLGDLMTGYIHEELQESNSLSPTETVLFLRKHIIAGLRLLKAEGKFKRIVIPCNVGNHGRTTKKMRHATSCQNSYEWMLYNVLRDDFPEAEWQIADGYFVYLTVYDRLFRFHHGDNVQYQGGIGGLTIPTEKAIAGWNKARTPYCDVFGHHHSAQQNPRWICNGSLIGYGAYSLAIKAGFEPPQQTYFLLDSKRGRTGTWPIHLN
jgi:hypothetical protein